MTSTPGAAQAHARGAACGLAAAALFGASAPLSKLFLPSVGLLMLAALLYLGAGLGLLAVRLLGGRSGAPREAPLRRADAPWLAGIVLLGGIAGPVLMLTGLRQVSGTAGALLLNLEAPLTMLVAVAAFREHLGGRAALSALLIVLGAALLSYGPGSLSASWAGAGAIAGACLCWAVDNNLSQRLSLRDPIAVVQVKTLGAGACTLLVALAAGQAIPPPAVLLLALGLGSVSYGLSLVLDMQALRLLGAAREAAYFATAPFLGALLSIPLLGERPGRVELAAAALMVAGVALLRTERHAHAHTHEAIEHDHLHTHDEHHRHDHDGPSTEPHAHSHRHEAMTHDHPHVPDLHHRHGHR
jgi:drug/metabolite transporter (DMT)-like permease